VDFISARKLLMSSLSREAPDAHDVRGEDFRAKNGFFSARQCRRRRRRAPQGYKEQTHTYKPHFAAQGKRCVAPGKANYDADWKAELHKRKSLRSADKTSRPDLSYKMPSDPPFRKGGAPGKADSSPAD
jgi:hypothetical protein